MKRPVSIGYMDSGTRWMEKQEAKSLRMALEDMDLEEETKVHAAARDEAAELVYRHRNPEVKDAPYVNPEFKDAPHAHPEAKGQRDYKSHLTRGSYQRSISQEVVPVLEARKTSGGSQRASIDAPSLVQRGSMETTRKVSPPTASMPLMPSLRKARTPSGKRYTRPDSSSGKARTPSGKSYGPLADAVSQDVTKAYRRTSSGGGNKRIMSGEKKLYMHRNDRIYEDPEEVSVPERLQRVPEPVQEVIAEPVKRAARDAVKPAITPVQPTSGARVRNNPFARVRGLQQGRLEHSASAPVLPVAAKPQSALNPPVSASSKG